MAVRRISRALSAAGIGPAAALPAAAAAVVLIVLAAWVLAGGFGTISRERIEVLDARVPLPSTPGLTALYLTIRDTGAQGDELVSASSAQVHEAMLAGEQKTAGAGAMKRLSAIEIPAHGAVALGPYTDDIMLEDTTALRLGESVTLTLTFRTLGPVTLQARVVPPGTA